MIKSPHVVWIHLWAFCNMSLKLLVFIQYCIINTMDSCVFCKIIKGEEGNTTIVFENDTIIAIKPLSEIKPGHTLVIPKQHYVDLFDIPEGVLKNLISVSQQLAKSLKDKYKSTGINLLHASGKDAGQSVFHFHIHVVPRFVNDGLDLWPKKNL